MILISALLLGFLSSWHCIGMCGPLVMAIHSAGGGKFGTFLYNGGRILMYMLLGAFMGTIGMGAYLLDLQQYFAILLGVIVLILIFKQSWLNAFTARYQRSGFMTFLRKHILNKNNFKKPQGKFISGLANGLLPCGLVYVALAGALSQPSIVDGMIYMGVFGLGTLPAMMLTQLVPMSWIRKPMLRKWAFAGMLVISCLFFYRAVHFQQHPEHNIEHEGSSFMDGIPTCGI